MPSFLRTFARNKTAMAKDKIAYVCENCGQESPKWIGKCPACGQWNTFKEIRVADTRQQAAAASVSTAQDKARNTALRLRDISAHGDPRIDMHDTELNRVREHQGQVNAPLKGNRYYFNKFLSLYPSSTCIC